MSTHALRPSVLLSGAAVLVAAFAGHAQVICGTWEATPPLGTGGVDIRAILEFQGEVYVAGWFVGASGTCVTRWNGTAFVPLSQQLPPGTVTSLAVYDDGTGPALYAGGHSWTFGSSPQTHYGVLKWNGVAWSGTGHPIIPMISGNPGVTDMVAYDDGQGMALYAATPGSSGR